MKCPTCQHEVTGRFCPNCGTDVRVTRPASDPNSTSVISPADLRQYAQRRPGPTLPGAGEPQSPPTQVNPSAAVPPSTYPQAPAHTPYGAASQGPYGQQPYAPQPEYGQLPASGQQPQSPHEFAPTGVQTGYPQQAPARKGRPLLVIALVLGGVLLLAIAGIVVLAHLPRSDSGKVKFGTAFKRSGNAFSIQNETSTFGPSDQVAWVGLLKDDVPAGSLRRTIARVNGNGSSSVIVSGPVQFTTQTSSRINQVAARESVASLEEVGINPPGTYRVTYLSNGKTEATGTFTLSGASPIGSIFFGTSTSEGVITGLSQHSIFGHKDTMTYAAHFPAPEGPGKLTVRFVRIRSDGSEQPVSHGLYDDLTTSGIRVRVNQISAADLPRYGASKPGVYILRYIKGKALLAEGKFTLHR